MTLPEMKQSLFSIMFNFIKDLLPNRTKRMVFLTSLTARLKGSEKLDSETLDKLNKTLVLCNNSHAMELPVLLSSAIWQGRSCEQIIHAEKQTNLSCIKETAIYIMNIMPEWLRYDSDDTIEKDIEYLLKDKNLLFENKCFLVA